QETLVGLRKVAAREDPVASVSCDSWGVDYMLFETDGSLINPTYHYRDPRCESGMKDVLAKIPWETIYADTGIQKMPKNPGDLPRRSTCCRSLTDSISSCPAPPNSKSRWPAPHNSTTRPPETGPT